MSLVPHPSVTALHQDSEGIHTGGTVVPDFLLDHSALAYSDPGLAGRFASSSYRFHVLVDTDPLYLSHYEESTIAHTRYQYNLLDSLTRVTNAVLCAGVLWLSLLLRIWCQARCCNQLCRHHCGLQAEHATQLHYLSLQHEGGNVLGSNRGYQAIDHQALRRC